MTAHPGHGGCSVGRSAHDAEAAYGAAADRTRVWLLNGVTAALFLASRLVLHVAGGRFTTSTTADLALLDPAELARDPFLAFTANHIQPPLWNFFVGSVLRWSPFPTGGTFGVLFLLCGLVTVLALRSLLSELGAQGAVAVTAATLVGWSPVTIGYEQMLTYEAPVAMLVTLAAWAFARWVRSPSTSRLVFFSACMVTGALTRTTLSPLWLIGGLAIAVLAGRGRTSPGWHARVGIAVAALVVVAAPLAHRAAAFHVASFSSYGGMNLARTSIVQWPRDSIDDLVDRGRISAASEVIPYAPYEEYAPFFPECEPRGGGQPVLDDFYKSDGTTNLNNVCYVEVGSRVLGDSLRVIRSDPARYLDVVAKSTLLYSSWEVPGTVPEGFPGARGQPRILRGWTKLYRPLVLPLHIDYSWGFGDPQSSVRVLESVYATPLARTDFSFTVAASLVLAVVLGALGTARWLRARASRRDLIRVYIGFTVLSITVVSVVFDTFENARFRAPLDPIVLGPAFALVLGGVVRFGRVVLARLRPDV